MALPTNIRAGRAAALLMGVQAAKGTPVSAFNSSDAGLVWSEEYGSDVTRRKSGAEGWMTSELMHQVGRFSIPSAREGFMRLKATPTALEWLLRSNWGSFSGGAFSLAGQVPAWLTLGFIEDAMPNPSGVLHRIYDAWPHTLSLVASLYEPLLVEAIYAAEREQDPESVGSVTHPARPMFPGDSNLFPGRQVKIYRDPAGDNQEIPYAAASLILEQGVLQEWDMMQQREVVFKGGHPGPRVTIELVGHVADETWRLIYDSRADTKSTYRFQATAEDPATVLEIDLHAVDWEVEEIGHEGQQAKRFRAVGTAHYDGTDFVDISLS